MLGYKAFKPFLEEKKQEKEYAERYSDSESTGEIKGEIRIGYDDWIGYVPGTSSQMKIQLQKKGYSLIAVNDQANVSRRMEQIKTGELDFAFVTVDSYFASGQSLGFPGKIVAVIDQSQGGDAIVAYGDKLANIDALKSTPFKVAFAGNSPSAYFLKVIGSHFDIPKLATLSKEVCIQTAGSEEALKELQARKVDVAVLWEPYVSKALSVPGIEKVLGTESTQNLIVDVLVVSDKFLAQHGSVVDDFLQTYFIVLKELQDDTPKFVSEIQRRSRLSDQDIEKMLKGVAFVGLHSNAEQWFGIGNQDSTERLMDCIISTEDILVQSGDVPTNTLPNGSAYSIVDHSFVKQLYDRSIKINLPLAENGEVKFAPLSKEQWGSLKEVGTMKVEPITFSQGSAELTFEGKEQIDQLVQRVAQYPGFRILVKGHTGTRGDPEANKSLSQERADSVKRYLTITHSFEEDRVWSVGLGGERPLPHEEGESLRAYQYRLPRVEISFAVESL